MSSMRLQRVSELIKQIVGDTLKYTKDPRIGFVTVTSVEVSPDLSLAKVFVSILGEEEEVNKSLEGLQSASGYIRREMAKEIHLRKIPSVVFYFDQGIQRGSRILKILEDLKPFQADDDNETAVE